MQQVNLLADEFRPRIEPLTARQLLVAWGGLVAVLAVVSAWQGLHAWSLAATETKREGEWRAMTQANEQLRASVASEPEQELVSSVQALRDRYRSQTQMVEAVRGYERSGDGGFSGYLTDLAAQHVEGLALDRIELRQGGSHILLSGETLAPIHVPRFLKRLSDGGSFRGHRFDEFRLEAQDSGLLRFDIVGPRPEAGGRG